MSSGNSMVMLDVRLLGIALVLAGAASRAEADCAVVLQGDPAVTAQVQAELGGFGDADGACIALWVTCSGAPDRLTIELRDELGRSSLRSFASPSGAAAFVVSWSRRPLAASAAGEVAHAAVPPPAVAQRGDPAVSSDASRTGPWRLALGVAYVRTSGVDETWSALTGSLLRHRGPLRFGVTLRAAVGSDVRYVNTEAEAMLGLGAALLPWLVVRGEVAVGCTLLHSTDDTFPDAYGKNGWRGGVRGAIGWQLAPSLALELGAGGELNRPFSLRESPDTTFSHFDVGMRWVL